MSESYALSAMVERRIGGAGGEIVRYAGDQSWGVKELLWSSRDSVETDGASLVSRLELLRTQDAEGL